MRMGFLVGAQAWVVRLPSNKPTGAHFPVAGGPAESPCGSQSWNLRSEEDGGKDKGPVGAPGIWQTAYSLLSRSTWWPQSRDHRPGASPSLSAATNSPPFLLLPFP